MQTTNTYNIISRLLSLIFIFCLIVVLRAVGFLMLGTVLAMLLLAHFVFVKTCQTVLFCQIGRHRSSNSTAVLEFIRLFATTIHGQNFKRTLCRKTARKKMRFENGEKHGI